MINQYIRYYKVDQITEMDPAYLNNIISVVVASIILPFTLFFGMKSVILGIIGEKTRTNCK